MSKKGFILCTTLLFSSAIAFADTDMQSNSTNTNANGQNATTSTPSTDTSTPSTTDTNASGTTPSSDGQETSNTNINQTTTNVNIANVNVTEVNNKVSITGVTTEPTFTNVEIRNNVYYLPETVTPISGFYFLNINSTERVCSLEKITAVKVLSTPTTITVMTREKELTLYCYERQDFNF